MRVLAVKASETFKLIMALSGCGIRIAVSDKRINSSAEVVTWPHIEAHEGHSIVDGGRERAPNRATPQPDGTRPERVPAMSKRFSGFKFPA